MVDSMKYVLKRIENTILETNNKLKKEMEGIRADLKFKQEDLSKSKSNTESMKSEIAEIKGNLGLYTKLCFVEQKVKSTEKEI